MIIEKSKNEDGNQECGEEIEIDKPVLKKGEVTESAYKNKGIGGEHAIDTIHKVVDIKDAGKNNCEKN